MIEVTKCFEKIVITLKLQPSFDFEDLFYNYIQWFFFLIDRKLAKELCRLPVLWMDPKTRTVENLHEHMLQTLSMYHHK